jgi:RNA polymerase sigma-70 factor (ECF subfamily)
MSWLSRGARSEDLAAEPETSLRERDNDQWLADLSQPGAARDAALGDLRHLLVRGLGYALAKYVKVREADIEDFAQEALLRILDALDSFRGESRFTTWAQKIAVHVAFTELRRRRWRDVSLNKVIRLPEGGLLPQRWVDPSARTEQQTLQREVMETLGRVVAQDLTDRQREAFTAVYIHGMPLDEVARRMDTNRNALYKLLFDTRKKIRDRMIERGLSSDDVRQAFRS